MLRPRTESGTRANLRSANRDRTAYRFAGTTLAIVVLASHERAGWVSALHRFVEVSIGIAVGLLIMAVWPEREAPATAKPT